MQKQGPPALLDESRVSGKKRSASASSLSDRTTPQSQDGKRLKKTKDKGKQRATIPWDESSSSELLDDNFDIPELGHATQNNGLGILENPGGSDQPAGLDNFVDSDAEQDLRREDMWSDSDSSGSNQARTLNAANIEGLSGHLDAKAAQEAAAAQAELEEAAIQTNIAGEPVPGIDDVVPSAGGTSKLRVAPNLQLLRGRITDTIRFLENFSNHASSSKDKVRSRSDYVNQLVNDISSYYGYSTFLAYKLFELFSPSEAFAFFEANETQRPVVIRANTLKTSRRNLADSLLNRGVKLEPVGKWTKVGLQIFESQVPLGATPEYLSGQYMLQAASSFLPVLALAPQEEERVLDMSAAPGGKTTYLSALMKNTGVIYANDSNKERAKALIANINRLGVKNAIVSNLDAQVDFPKTLGGFDRVLLDAPCSGTGVIAKDPIVKTNKTEKDFIQLPETQKKLLLAAIDSTKTGGHIVYSTCSVTREECEAVVAYGLARRPNVELVSTALDLGTNGLTNFKGYNYPPSLKLTKRFYPHSLNVDGFYVAKFKKTSAGSTGPTQAASLAIKDPSWAAAGSPVNGDVTTPADKHSISGSANPLIPNTVSTDASNPANSKNPSGDNEDSGAFGSWNEDEDTVLIERARRAKLKRKGLNPNADKSKSKTNFNSHDGGTVDDAKVLTNIAGKKRIACDDEIESSSTKKQKSTCGMQLHVAQDAPQYRPIPDANESTTEKPELGHDLPDEEMVDVSNDGPDPNADEFFIKQGANSNDSQDNSASSSTEHISMMQHNDGLQSHNTQDGLHHEFSLSVSDSIPQNEAPTTGVQNVDEADDLMREVSPSECLPVVKNTSDGELQDSDMADVTCELESAADDCLSTANQDLENGPMEGIVSTSDWSFTMSNETSGDVQGNNDDVIMSEATPNAQTLITLETNSGLHNDVAGDVEMGDTVPVVDSSLAGKAEHNDVQDVPINGLTATAGSSSTNTTAISENRTENQPAEGAPNNGYLLYACTSPLKKRLQYSVRKSARRIIPATVVKRSLSFLRSKPSQILSNANLRSKKRKAPEDYVKSPPKRLKLEVDKQSEKCSSSTNHASDLLSLSATKNVTEKPMGTLSTPQTADPSAEKPTSPMASPGSAVDNTSSQQSEANSSQSTAAKFDEEQTSSTANSTTAPITSDANLVENSTKPAVSSISPVSPVDNTPGPVVTTPSEEVSAVCAVDSTTNVDTTNCVDQSGLSHFQFVLRPKINHQSDDHTCEHDRAGGSRDPFPAWQNDQRSNERPIRRDKPSLQPPNERVIHTHDRSARGQDRPARPAFQGASRLPRLQARRRQVIPAVPIDSLARMTERLHLPADDLGHRHRRHPVQHDGHRVNKTRSSAAEVASHTRDALRAHQSGAQGKRSGRSGNGETSKVRSKREMTKVTPEENAANIAAKAQVASEARRRKALQEAMERRRYDEQLRAGARMARCRTPNIPGVSRAVMDQLRCL